VTDAARVEGAQLKPAQRRALDALANGDRSDLTRARYQELAGVSRSQAAYDLADLVEAGILVRVGAGRATSYRLAPAQQSSSRRRWTSDRIREELAAFCSGRTSWPSAGEFKRAGRSDLYVAASRYGGIGFWATELGLSRPGATVVDEPRRRALFRGRAKPALAAVLLAVLGAATAAAAVVVQQRHDDRGKRSASVSRSRGHRLESLGNELRWVRLGATAGRSAQAAAERPRPLPRRAPRVAEARPAPLASPAPPASPTPEQPAPELVASHPPASAVEPVAKRADPVAPSRKPKPKSKPEPKPKPEPESKPSSSWPAPLPAPAASSNLLPSP
jgi:hypothetical protein